MSSSDEAIRILKLEEGFSEKPYWVYAQWTVGYGTRCPDSKLEEYKKNGFKVNKLGDYDLTLDFDKKPE